ncbi:MAG: hypothetical protein IPK82_25090 [Polyangiaceae bacterium]|nr:hypothetical protein [Polyangiaceae bacterium]
MHYVTLTDLPRAALVARRVGSLRVGRPRTARAQRRSILSLVLFLASFVLVGLTSSPARAYTCKASDNLSAGQAKINQGLYSQAVHIFTCVIQASPTTVDAYRGRAEARLMMGQYSEAYRDLYARLISAVQPPDILALGDQVISSYDARLQNCPWDVHALTGGAFARWSYYTYADAIPLLDKLLVLNPNNTFAYLFRGSNRLFAGIDIEAAQVDLETAIDLNPASPDVRYVVADAYTYALPDLDRAYQEASLALMWGLDTPRVHAILGAALNDVGETVDAAEEIKQHIDQSTTKCVNVAPLAVGRKKRVALAPGKTFLVPIQVSAGQSIKVTTSTPSDNVYDSILVLLDPSGNPVLGSDDTIGFFAAIDWVAPVSGTYKVKVTSFEAIFTGPLDIRRD